MTAGVVVTSQLSYGFSKKSPDKYVCQGFLSFLLAEAKASSENMQVELTHNKLL
jgi:hypothetical protein